MRIKIAIASAALILVVRFFSGTMRLKAPDRRIVQERRNPGEALLFAVWHGDHFPLIYTYRRCGFCAITSLSADGQILTNILQHFGSRCVRGSSMRGGIRALIRLARAVRAGSHAVIAVDGPRGPRRQAKAGIVLLAKTTGRPIIPTACAMSRYWEFRSWDRFRLAKPFTRAAIATGEPIEVPPDADDAAIEAKRGELEQSLLALQEGVENEVKR